jgi:hypothetical protein
VGKTPRIGRSEVLKDQEADEMIAASATPMSSEPVAAMVTRFANKAAEADAERAEQRRQEARAAERGMIAEARSLETRHGILKKKYQARADAAAGTNWRALYAAVPEGLVFNEKLQRMVPTNHDVLRLYQAAVADAYAMLNSTFGSANQGRDLTPVGLAIAAQEVERAIQGGATHDDLHGVLSQSYRGAVRWLEFWFEKGRQMVQSTEEAVDRFLTAEVAAREILAKASPQEVAPTPVKATLPVLEPQPQGSATSFCEFDPRNMGGDR